MAPTKMKAEPQMRKLDRRAKDAEDRTRFLLVSVFTPKFVLYYQVSDDVYVVNTPTAATLFKRELAARAINAQLGEGNTLMRCRVDSRGKLVERSISRSHLRRAALVKEAMKRRSAYARPKRDARRTRRELAP